jgi:hypothetical protein
MEPTNKKEPGEVTVNAINYDNFTAPMLTEIFDRVDEKWAAEVNAKGSSQDLATALIFTQAFSDALISNRSFFADIRPAQAAALINFGMRIAEMLLGAYQMLEQTDPEAAAKVEHRRVN